MTGKTKTYASAEAFRTALEAKAKADAKANGLPLDVARRARAFEAFLLRVGPSGQPLVLKGGFAMYVRYSAFARPTRDMDLAVMSDEMPDDIERKMHGMLVAVAEQDIGDFFSFVVGESSDELGKGREFDGWRFPVEAKIGGRQFDKFHLDMSTGDAILAPLDRLPVGKTLAFAGVTAGQVEMIRLAQHYSEKLHAYVRDRGGKENGRVKDLFDMVYFIKNGIEAKDVAAVVDTVFRHCGGPEVPKELDPPPRSWRDPYEEMSSENGLGISFEEAYRMICRFHDEMISAVAGKG